MGTTLVAAHFNGSDFELAWVGDSRAYLVSADGSHSSPATTAGYR